jgi:hypothetical protein
MKKADEETPPHRYNYIQTHFLQKTAFYYIQSQTFPVVDTPFSLFVGNVTTLLVAYIVSTSRMVND